LATPYEGGKRRPGRLPPARSYAKALHGCLEKAGKPRKPGQAQNCDFTNIAVTPGGPDGKVSKGWKSTI